jgi:uncharacterized phage protein gp47/JayE
MAITRVTLPTIAQLADQYKEDVRRLKIRAVISNPNVAPGSETAIKAEAAASLAFQLYAQIAATQDATMPDTAIGDDLARLALVWRGMNPSLGAGAQGYVVADCVGVVVYPKDLECRSVDGLRYKVVSSTAAVAGTLIPVIGIDTGKRTDKAAATVMTWSSPPAGSNTTAVVGPSGLTNGTDPDDDARLRARFTSSLRHPGASGSWAHYVEWAEANAAVEKAYCYPAIQGPSTVHVAYTVVADRDNLTGAYTREGSVALTGAVALAVVGSDPEHADVTTTTVADENVDVVLKATLPLPIWDGGPGGGWLDGDTGTGPHWPACWTAAPYATAITAITSQTLINVNVLDASNIPLVDAQIAFWSNTDKEFVHAKVKTVTLVAGTTYTIELYSAIDTSKLAVGDYVSPDAENLDDYGETIAAQFGGLGPGEKTSSANLLPRSYRHPLPSEEWPSQFTSTHVGKLSIEHPEITHISVMTPSLPKAPTVAAAVTDPPNILVLGKLAIYKA